MKRIRTVFLVAFMRSSGEHGLTLVDDHNSICQRHGLLDAVGADHDGQFGQSSQVRQNRQQAKTTLGVQTGCGFVKNDDLEEVCEIVRHSN